MKYIHYALCGIVVFTPLVNPKVMMTTSLIAIVVGILRICEILEMKSE